MGWGLSIRQDGDGYVYCEEADFYTGPEDYEGLPPSSYEFIADGVESYHDMIDMARDEQGEDAAREECMDAFNATKGEWEIGVSDKEKREIHEVWLEEKLKALDSAICIVDHAKKTATEEKIDEFLKEHKEEMDRLKGEITALEKLLADKISMYESKRQPLQRLERDLEQILVPQKTRQKLLELIDEEKKFNSYSCMCRACMGGDTHTAPCIDDSDYTCSTGAVSIEQ